MKRYLFLISIISIPLVSKSQFSGTSYKEAQQTKKANWVFTYAETPGFASSGSTNNLTGICPDIMEDFKKFVEEEEGIKVSIKVEHGSAKNFQKFLNEMKPSKSGVFGLGNITITEERKKAYQFSPPFITNISVIVTSNSVPTLSSLTNIEKEFKGKMAYTVVNSTNSSSLKKLQANHFPSMEIMTLNSSPEVLERVLNDPNSFANIDFTYWLFALKRKQKIKRHPAGDESTEEFGIIMSKENDWSPLLSKFFHSGYMGSTQYKKIIAKHLGQNALDLVESVSRK